MIIVTKIGSKYATFHHIIELVNTEANLTRKEAAKLQTPPNKATAHYNLILITVYT